MGATNFEVISKGMDAKSAFENAVNDAIYYYGHEPYSGTIKEKSSFVEIPLPKGKEPEVYADELMWNNDPRISDKWGPAGCILISESNLEKDVAHSAFKVPVKRSGARKWKTVYDVKTEPSGDVRSRHRTQGEAEKSARRLAVDENKRTYVMIEKTIEDETNLVCSFEPKTKKEVVTGGIKKYLFFGIASE